MTTRLKPAYVEEDSLTNLKVSATVTAVIATDSNWNAIGNVFSTGEPTYVFANTGSSYNVASESIIKVWAVGAGGGGGGVPASDGTAAGSGGAGGVAVKTWTGSGTITYTRGAAGTAGPSSGSGGKGGNTTVTFAGETITAEGGFGGLYNVTTNVEGGSATGGDVNVEGGQGGGMTGDDGGGGGGGIGNADNPYVGSSNNGYNGAQSNDVSGLQAAVEALGLSWTGPGLGSTSTSGNNANGGSATGFGCGGGGASYWGGYGGAGLYGGGGGGAAAYNSARTGGVGGAGVVVMAITELPNQLSANSIGYIEIQGSDFGPADRVMIGLQYIATSVTLANSNIIRAQLPSNIPAGTRDVYVIKPNGNYSIKANVLTHA